MKRNLLIITAALVATGSLYAAPKDDVLAAAKKLADASSYSWSSSTTNLGGGGGGGGRGGRGGGPLSGSASKDGFAFVTATGGQGNTEAAIKGDKVAVKPPDGGWQTVQEAIDGGARGAGRFRTLKVPAVEAKELAEKAKDLKAAGDAIAGDLGADAVGPLLAAGGRGGGGNPPPAPANAKGSVKFWVKDGTLAKYEYNVQGTMSFGGNDVEINRTTTIEIKEVGTAKVNVPEDAKKKLQ